MLSLGFPERHALLPKAHYLNARLLAQASFLDIIEMPLAA